MNKKQTKNQPVRRSFPKKGIDYWLWGKRIAILCLAAFSASFVYHFIAPSPTANNSSPVKDMPSNAANKMREVLGLEVPQQTLSWWDTIKSVVTWRNTLKLVVVVIGLIVLYKSSSWLKTKWKSIKWN